MYTLNLFPQATMIGLKPSINSRTKHLYKDYNFGSKKKEVYRVIQVKKKKAKATEIPVSETRTS